MDLKLLISEFKNEENQKRLRVSKAQFEIYRDVLEPHVKAYLQKFYTRKSIEDVPLLTTVNLAKRIVDAEASLYRKSPNRKFFGLSERQVEILTEFYEKLNVDHVLLEANRYFKLQDIVHLYFYVNQDTGKIKLIPLKAHQVFPVTDKIDNSEAIGYAIPSADWKMVGWFFNGAYIETTCDGDVINQITDDSLMLPIVVARKIEHDSYWPNTGTALTDFTIQFNALMSDIANIVRMQGFAQAYLKGARNMLPESIKIGPNNILMLPVDPNNPVETEFGFANPSPDLGGSLEFMRSVLSAFLTSRGLSPKVINTQGVGQEYNSGLDRLLAAIERFEASEGDMKIFERAENELLKLFVKHLNDTDQSFGVADVDEVAVSVTFEKPSAVMGEKEKLDLILAEKEAGLISDVDAIQKWHGIPRQEAEQKLMEILGGVRPQAEA